MLRTSAHLLLRKKFLQPNRSLHMLQTVTEVRKIRKDCTKKDQHVGFVPTMGALHDGHIHLMKQSKSENDITIASIFVNPSQFSVGEDLDKYPRTLENDLDKLKTAGVDYVFVPDGKGIYENWPNFKQLCHVEPSAFSEIPEGKARPEFFRGVATIVTKLLNIVTPDVAYFGQKDISQCILVRSLVQDLNIPTKICVIETIRDEKDGLALSSRNTYLNEKERKAAGVLYRALKAGEHAIVDTPESVTGTQRQKTTEAIMNELDKEELVSRIEYVSIANHKTMEETENPSEEDGCVLSAAIHVGKVRLIDNILVGKAKELLHEPKTSTEKNQ